ncbi:MAG: trypsin-like peptidase domain-containing protein [bacterium]
MAAMKGRDLKRWAVFSGTLGLGMLVGLVLAGSWNVTPEGLAGDRDPVTAVEGPPTGFSAAEVLREVPAELDDPPASAVQRVQQMPSLSGAAKKLRPAVVFVEVRRWVEGRDPHSDLNIPEELRDMFPNLQVPQQEPRPVTGHGSGFIFTRDGYILTNNHVVEDAAEVEVVLPDKRRFKAEVTGSDPITDVAVVKIDTDEQLPTVELGDSDAARIGDWVLAIGNPLEFNFTVTAGIISARGRSLRIGPTDQAGTSQMIQDFIQTDAAINQGNSGGPLVDMNGRVIGINSAIASTTGMYQGYGFAIPINLVREVAGDLIEYGEVKRAWLGITFREVDAQIARANSLPVSPPVGVLIERVVEGGPAEEAGIRQGDILLEIEGEAITNSGQLQTLVSTRDPGTGIDVTVYRGGSSRQEGERKHLTVELEERPPLEQEERARPGPTEADPLGVEARDPTRSEARRMGFDGEGVLVTGLDPRGPMADAGFLRGGFVIVSVDGQETPDMDAYRDVVKELEEGTAIMVRVWVPSQAGGQYSSVAVEIG